MSQPPTIWIQFVEEGTAENPLPPRAWSFVPRVGETVEIPETGRVYRIVGVQWTWDKQAAGAPEKIEPRVIVHVAE